MTTPAEVLETPAFRLTLPGGESHRIVAADGAAAKKLLRAKLELSRLPAGVKVEDWEGTGPVEEPSGCDGPEAEGGEQPSGCLGDVADAEDTPASPKPAKRSASALMASLSDAEKARHLLDHQTIPDRSWTEQTREKGEKRSDFIVRVLGDPA